MTVLPFNKPTNTCTLEVVVVEVSKALEESCNV